MNTDMTDCDEEISLTEEEKPSNPLLRFWDFFVDVPLYSGHEWKTLSPQEIAAIFIETAEYVVRKEAEAREQAISEHDGKWWIARWWSKNVHRWKPPHAVSLEEVIKDMQGRCNELADWMQTTQHCAFYMGSDMSHFIWKPRAVASLIAERISSSDGGDNE